MTALSHRLQPLFGETKTVCFGQFVLEVPTTAIIVYGPTEVDTNIDRYPNEAEEIQEFIAEQLKKIEENKDYLDDEFIGKDSMYGKVIKGARPGQKQVIGESQGAYQIHSYVPIGQDLYIFKKSSIDPNGSRLQQKIAQLNAIASRLRARADDEVPAEPGSCIDGGFVVGPAEFENITLGVRLAEFPDVHFSIRVSKNLQYLCESCQLEPRLKRAEKEAKLEGDGPFYARIKFFRRAPRKLGAWDGFEALARKPAREGASESHEFLYYSNGALNNPLQPVLDVQLDTGVQDNKSASAPPSLSDEEAVALWDKLLGSIRPRPAAPKASEPATPKLGARAQAGQPCPLGGWWECDDADDISGVALAGGRRQYFATRARMPQAVLLAPQSAWQKLTGEQPTFQRGVPSTWTLVDRRRHPRADGAAAANGAAHAPPPPAKDAHAAPPDTPVGERRASGAPCPASGWWMCREAGAPGGARWFGCGQILPTVAFRAERTWLDKLKGEPATLRRAGAWEFVRADERPPTPPADGGAAAKTPGQRNDPSDFDT